MGVSSLLMLDAASELMLLDGGLFVVRVVVRVVVDKVASNLFNWFCMVAVLAVVLGRHRIVVIVLILRFAAVGMPLFCQLVMLGIPAALVLLIELLLREMIVFVMVLHSLVAMMLVVSVVHRHSLDLVVVVLVVMRVRPAHFFGGRMVVRALRDDVLLRGPRYREMHRMVCLIVVMVSVILVSVGELRGHVMV